MRENSLFSVIILWQLCSFIEYSSTKEYFKIDDFSHSSSGTELHMHVFLFTTNQSIH